MKKRIGVMLAIVAAAGLLFSACASTSGKTATTKNGSKPAITKNDGKTYELTILHVNDSHGAVLATENGEGGFVSMATYVKNVRAQNKNTLFMHAGDINTGSALSNMFNAEPDIVSFNEMGCDVATFGNHEFDGTLEKLQQQMKISKFPWISANIKMGNKYLGEPYIIKDYDGFRVAVIGLTTLRTLVIASPDKSLTFIDEIEAAKEMVKLVREKEKADIVIISAHMGDVLEAEDQNTTIKLAEQVSGIDLIVDGHAHSLFAEPKVVNGTPIVTANEYGKYIGNGVMKIVNGKKVSFTWKPIAITTKAFPPDANLDALLKPYIDKANASLKDVVLKTTDLFEFGNRLTRYKEMAIGDFITDAIVSYVESTGVKVDGAIVNGGGIRAELPKGDVTRENIMTVLPFENYVYVLTLKGSDVVKLFEFIGSVKPGAGAFAQVSKNIRYTITYDSDGNSKISDVTIGGNPIDTNRTYRIATNDYMAKGGDGYTVFTTSIDTYNTSVLMSTAVIEYAATLKKAVTPATDGRINLVGGKEP